MSQVSVARFKFEAFGLEYGSGVHEDAEDDRGTKWQIEFDGFEHDFDYEPWNNASARTRRWSDTSGHFYFCIRDDTNPRVFRHVLRYIYGGSAPSNEEMVELGKDIIDACDQFDVVGLKISAETALVQKGVISVNNVADWIHYADAKTCPLLKE